MKTIIIISITLCTNLVVAQQTLDTIYANDKKNVALFFPEPIRQGVTGTSNFVFTYNREKEQYFGLLQATPGTESNLITVTKNGQVYSYILKYKEQLPKLNYFLSDNESIGNERPIARTTEPQKMEVFPSDKADYYQRACSYLLRSKGERVAVKRKKGLKLQLQKMTYYGSEVFLVIKVANRSGIDFDIDYLKVFTVNGNKKRKASHQRLEQKPFYKHQIPTSIAHGQIQRFVYVLPKFVLGNDEKLQVEMRERNGSREVVLSTRL
ncbi:DUF4138 domain-containing protein [Flagellimonas sp. CMM7]|uniref:DUF4138 domain-containing protein n=1 Tax=Flagellimonas sp. CMM7 TaxID=2654676 RepID=UPI0013D70FAD|nr:DUF4138 domain-containing protein [Flagellimonas sp. CMM7]UII78622.1 conjugative transposon protein TraN [Flagellimonas sp. CMM7]